MEMNGNFRQRKSNLELLRILAMLMIIMSHYAKHSGFESSIFFTNKFIIDILSAFGKLGVALFILISGYFNKKMNFKVKKLLDLLSKVWIYSMIGLIIAIFSRSELLGTVNIIKSIMPNLFGLYWFTSCYILIYLLSPFIKKVMDLMKKKDLKILLTLMILIWFCISIIPQTKTYCSEFLNCLTIYMLGAYINKYNLLENKCKKELIVCLVIILQIVLMLVIEILSLNIEKMKDYVLYFNQLNSPIILILSVVILGLFLNINIKNNLINNIATTTFGIYLFHDNIFLREIIWKRIVNGNAFINSPFLVIHAIISIFGVFLVSLVIDIIIENIIHKNLMKFLENLYIKIKNLKITENIYLKIDKFYNN